MGQDGAKFGILRKDVSKMMSCWAVDIYGLLMYINVIIYIYVTIINMIDYMYL